MFKQYTVHSVPVMAKTNLIEIVQPLAINKKLIFMPTLREFNNSSEISMAEKIECIFNTKWAIQY